MAPRTIYSCSSQCHARDLETTYGHSSALLRCNHYLRFKTESRMGAVRWTEGIEMHQGNNTAGINLVG